MNPNDGKALRGTGAILYLVTDAGDIPVLCATDMTLRWNREVIGATTLTSGSNKEKRTRLFEWFLSVTGLTPIENDDDTIGWFYLTQVSGSIQSIKAKYTDGNSVQKVVSGNVIIPSGELTSPATDWCNASLEFAGTGAMDISDPEPPPAPSSGFDVLSDWWPTVAGTSFVDVGAIASNEDGYTLTVNDEVLEVDRTGRQVDDVSGSPGNRQARFNTANLHVEVDAANPFDSGETVFVLFKRPI